MAKSKSADAARVFISYSRADLARAEHLREQLIAAGFEAYLDQHDIGAGEDWKERLGELIRTAEQVVFLISPKSAASKICDWEVNEAQRQGKPVLPVMIVETPMEEIPPRLQRLNFLFMRGEDERRAGLPKLIEALTIELAWEREKTRINAQAENWRQRDEPARLLIWRNDAIRAAEEWRDRAPNGAEPPSETQRAFIAASRRGFGRRQRLLLSLVAIVAVVTAGLAGMAYWQSEIARENEALAKKNETLAKTNEARAIEQRDTALTTQSWFLASLSDQERVKHDAASAVLLGLAGLPDAALGDEGKRPLTAEPASSLKRALAALRELKVLSGHSWIVHSVAFSPDGTRILTGSRDKTARLWDTASGKLLKVFSGHAGSVNSVGFSPDGIRILTGSFDNTARLWNAKSGKVLAVLSGHSTIVSSVSFSPDGTRILTGSADDTARLWDAASGKQLKVLSGHSNDVTSVAFSPDGSRILTGSWDNTARLWDAASGKQLKVFSGHTSLVSSVAFSPDGTRILTGSADNTARLWDAASGKEFAVLSGHSSRVSSVAFSPDGTRILTGSADNTARLWDAASGKLLTVLSGHSDDVSSVAFSPDGTRILTGSGHPLGSRDKTARLWDARTGKQMAVLSGHSSFFVSSVAFSPDGTRILTGSQDKTARLWDAASGKELAVLSGHSSPVTSVAFSPDGTRILTGSGDKTARLWDARTGQALVDHAKRRVPRCLTPGQRKEFFLPPEPPRWCITGPGLEAEKDPAKWKPKYPYQGEEWRDWLIAKDRGEEPELPAQ